MKRECGFSLPISVVSLSIAFVYFSTVFIFIDRWFGLFSSPGIMNSLAFTAVAIMCIFNYAVSVFTDPGRVPRTFVPDIEDAVTPIHEIKRKGGDLRYCQKCSHYKPPRAHHCRVCKRCVLRMDHHCIWINNCIGHANYKAFFIFIVCAVIASIYSLVLLVGSLTNDPEEDEQPSRDGDYSRTAYPKEKFYALFAIIKEEGYNLQKVICGLLLVPLSIALTVLLGCHIYLVLQNKTTIEYREGVRAMWLAEKGGEVYQHPYDLGAYTNLTTVLGPSILSWVFPMSGHIGTGLRFRTAFDNPAAALRSN